MRGLLWNDPLALLRGPTESSWCIHSVRRHPHRGFSMLCHVTAQGGGLAQCKVYRTREGMVNSCSLLICHLPFASSTGKLEAQTANFKHASGRPCADNWLCVGDSTRRVLHGGICVQGTISFQKWDRCQQKRPQSSHLCE